MEDCIFCQIVKKEIPSQTVYQDEKIIVFKDTNPVAPVHLLIVPKEHIPSVNHLEKKDQELIGQIFLLAQKIARDQGIAESGYRLSFNVGRNAGQTVDHLHLHLMGGEKLPWP